MGQLQVFDGLDMIGVHNAPVHKLRFSHDGRWLASADTERVLRIWHESRLAYEVDLSSEDERMRPIDVIRDFVFDRAGRTLIVGNGGTLQALDLLHWNWIWDATRPPAWGFLITCPLALDIAPTGELAVCYDDGTIEVWNPQPDTLADLTWYDNEAPKMMQFAADGRTIVGTDGYSVCAWDSTSGKRHFRLRPTRQIFAFAVSRVSSLIAFRSLQRLHIYDIEEAMQLACVDAKIGMPTLAFAHDRNLLAAGGVDGVALYDPIGNVVDNLESRSPVLSLQFKPGGAALVAGLQDGTIAQWPI
jgi:WD40 repeat protein